MRNRPELLDGVDLSTLNWQWPSESGPSSDDCVVVAAIPGGVAVGDSKDLTAMPLAFNNSEWRVFCAAIADGEYDNLIS